MIQKIFVVLSLLLFLPNLVSAQDITTGLIGHWKFDETSGTTATDSSGNNNTGTLTNGPAWTTGKIGGAVSFDGVNDYVNLGTSVDQTITNAITVSTWVKPVATFQGTFLVGSTDLVIADYDWGIYNTAGGNTFNFYIQNTSGVPMNAGSVTTAVPGAWIHVVGTYDGATIKLYINGVLENTVSQTGNIRNSNFVTHVAGGWNGVRYAGVLDDARLYSRALTTAEIQSLYALGTEGTPPPSDTQAPTTPTGLTANAISSSQINLSWSASTDNVGVAGYRIYRGGVQIATVNTTSYQNTDLSPLTSYSYTVAAYDAVGNVSQQSGGSVNATTQSSSSLNPLDNLQPGQWYEASNSNLSAVLPIPTPTGSTGPESIMIAWGGGIYDTLRNRLMVWGGGHGDYPGNEIYAFNVNTFAWTRLTNPSPVNSDNNSEYTADGLPTSRHTYSSLAYMANVDRMFARGGSLWQLGSTSRIMSRSGFFGHFS